MKQLSLCMLKGKSTVAARGQKREHSKQLVVRMPWLCGAAAAVMEGVTVGQVFDAECILSKRPRKVRRTDRWTHLHRGTPPRVLLTYSALFFISGEI